MLTVEAYDEETEVMIGNNDTPYIALNADTVSIIRVRNASREVEIRLVVDGDVVIDDCRTARILVNGREIFSAARDYERLANV